MRLRLLIEVTADEMLQREVAEAVESHEHVEIEMPGFGGSALSGQIVGAVPVEPVEGHLFPSRPHPGIVGT